MGWMAWSPVTATFYIVIGIILICMTIAEIKIPTIERKGFLPFISTTRGERLFIGLLGSAYIHLIFLAVSGMSLFIAFGISLVWLIAVIRWG